MPTINSKSFTQSVPIPPSSGLMKDIPITYNVLKEALSKDDTWKEAVENGHKDWKLDIQVIVISIPGHRLPIPPIPPVHFRSFFTNLGAPIFRNPLGTPRWSPPPPFNLLPMPP
ncbi:uncharacterized protein EI90DRAFT_3123890 [Cantharellus anzutake]|uniref:uncharacterized protein n=1 Tax=Cantharellus anzutake TaxID=1750568 RepID=UPI001907061B|nr:uncharacterized protein EI90DRAFT_3123890 [Cantharellus anzutake]KAF8331138.1 hypothetical protein EI90DRAFT_3123890 [Cantharellus anzutake]